MPGRKASSLFRGLAEAALLAILYTHAQPFMGNGRKGRGMQKSTMDCRGRSVLPWKSMAVGCVAFFCLGGLLVFGPAHARGVEEPGAQQLLETPPGDSPAQRSGMPPGPSSMDGAARVPLFPASGCCFVEFPEPTPESRQLQLHWQTVMERHDPEVAFGSKQTALPAPVREQWNALSRRAPKMSWTEQLQFVNAFFNNRGSVPDLENYGEEEYWATPEEFLQNGGDCEDFALAKYLALRRFGWPEEDLWLLLVEKRQEDGHHAVLAARKGGKIFILDNLSRPAHLLLTEEQFMRTFSPLYAINSLGIWRCSSPDGEREPVPGAAEGSAQIQ